MALRLLSVNRELRYIYLEGNPIAKTAGYRPMLTSLLPHLRSIDHKTLPRSRLGGSKRLPSAGRPGSPVRANGQGLRSGSPVRSTYNRGSTATSVARGHRGSPGQDGGSERHVGGGRGRTVEQQAEMRRLQKEADLARHQHHQQILRRRRERAGQLVSRSGRQAGRQAVGQLVGQAVSRWPRVESGSSVGRLLF